MYKSLQTYFKKVGLLKEILDKEAEFATLLVGTRVMVHARHYFISIKD